MFEKYKVVGLVKHVFSREMLASHKLALCKKIPCISSIFKPICKARTLVSIMKGLIWFSKASCDDDNVILCTKAMQRLAIKRLRTSSPPHFLNFKEK